MNYTLTLLDLIVIAIVAGVIVLAAETYWNRKTNRNRPGPDEEFLDRLQHGVTEGGLPLSTVQEVVKADVIAGKHRAGR